MWDFDVDYLKPPKEAYEI